MMAGFRHLILVVVATAISVSCLVHFSQPETGEPPKRESSREAVPQQTPSIAGIQLGMTPDEVQDLLGKPTLVREVHSGLAHWSYVVPYDELETPRNRQRKATLAITFEPNVSRASASAIGAYGTTDTVLQHFILKSDLMPQLSLGQSLGFFRGRLPGVTRIEKNQGPFSPKTGPRYFFSAGETKVAIATLENRVVGLCIAESFDQFWRQESSDPVLSEPKHRDDSTFCGVCFLKMFHGNDKGINTHPCPFACQDCSHNENGFYSRTHGNCGSYW